LYGWCRVVHVMSKLLGGHSVTVSLVSYHYHIKQQRVLGWLAQCSGSGNWCRPLSLSRVTADCDCDSEWGPENTHHAALFVERRPELRDKDRPRWYK
jgi:hypothetical protein